MKPDDKRQTCVCGHRYGVHANNGGPCLAADTPSDQRTGQGCQCKAWSPWTLDAVAGLTGEEPSE